YGSGDLGTAISAALRGFFLLAFLTDVARLNPALAGSILLVNRVWDAVNDPVIGWLSDRTVTRWGRRRPWLLIGALPFGLTFFLLWVVPPFETTGKALYYLVISLLLDTAYTVVNVPYTALTPELTRDYDERTSLNSYRFAFSVGGALVSAVLHPIIVGQFTDARTGYLVSGLIWAVVSTLSCFIVFAFTRERPETLEQRPDHAIPLRAQIRIALANRPYRFVIGIYLSSWLALQLVSAVLVYYLTYYMGAPERIPVTLLAVQGTSFVFLFVWSAVSRRLEKRQVYLMGGLLWLVVQIALFGLRPDDAALVIPLAMLAGAGVAVAYLIPWAMMPDIIELDELETGQRREGIFYGFMVFLQKAGIGAAIWLLGVALAAAGYITPSDAMPQPVQPDSALWAIRLFIGPVPALVLAGGLILAYFYPITRDVHRRMLAALAERRALPRAPKSEPLPAGD
ncbi:MAG TPA: MFS transporter, partial [Caldilineaceae bacterium]|nr:MFS transporter [Caldilineaceae bacterium]